MIKEIVVTINYAGNLPKTVKISKPYSKEELSWTNKEEVKEVCYSYEIWFDNRESGWPQKIASQDIGTASGVICINPRDLYEIVEHHFRMSSHKAWSVLDKVIVELFWEESDIQIPSITIDKSCWEYDWNYFRIGNQCSRCHCRFHYFYANGNYVKSNVVSLKQKDVVMDDMFKI